MDRLEQGGKIATRWRYPCEILIEELGSPFLTRINLAVKPVGNGSKVTWRFENESRNVLERFFIAIHRRQMDQVDSQHQGTVDRLQQEFEHRRKSGVGEAFDAYRATLDGHPG